MRATLKSLSDISNFHDLKISAKSGKPALPTTAILSLYMKGSEKARIERELKRMRKRKGQLTERLREVDKEMSKLLLQATDMAEKLRGKQLGAKSFQGNGGAVSRKGRVTVGY